jgi:hypothetical protein
MTKIASLVITSISAPNEALRKYASICKNNKVNFILIGDTKSPTDFLLENCDFWSIDRQASLNNELANLLPVRHYSRKNIGYLLSMQNGSEIIIETDDDNFPYDSFFDFLPEQMEANTLSNNGWLNIYNFFSSEKIWPRGLPLEEILSAKKEFKKNTTTVNCPIQQGLADDNPDVDAVFRLTHTLPLKFDKDLIYALGKNTWCPFNSQNTVWYRDAFQLMYLPSYCSFRMTDIWRSFVAQRIAWENNWNILFYSPTVYQERNEHNLLKDFEDEIPGYLNNNKIMKALQELKLKSGTENHGGNLIRCYEKLIEMKLVDEKELALVQAWNKHF